MRLSELFIELLRWTSFGDLCSDFAVKFCLLAFSTAVAADKRGFGVVVAVAGTRVVLESYSISSVVALSSSVARLCTFQLLIVTEDKQFIPKSVNKKVLPTILHTLPDLKELLFDLHRLDD